MKDYTITFATLNGLEYTKKCIDSLLSAGVEESKIVAVDNASSDGTVEYLQGLNLGAVILNRQNLSCGAAWNQGILARQTEWTIVMNNDIVVAPRFAERLIKFAEDKKLKLVSPARIDGTENYNFLEFAENAQKKMNCAVRWGESNAICMCIHWSLFDQVGFFRASPKLLGFEDGLFYNEIRKEKINHATTGSVWIHHHGSVTQEHLKKIKGIEKNIVLVKVNDRNLYRQGWLERKIYRFQMKWKKAKWFKNEIRAYGMSLEGKRHVENFEWK